LPFAPAAACLQENRIRINAILKQSLPLGLERTCRTVPHALTAKNASGVHHTIALEGPDGGLEATAGNA
jgi:hypothetical protein